MKVIVFNGPANTGKDHAADLICKHFPHVKHRRFKDRLFEIVAAVYGVSLERLKGELYTRENKEKPHDCFGGLSTRQAMIKVSEEVIKPSMGQNYFGEALANSLDSELTVISDSGGWFEEFLPVVDRVEPENALVIKILRTGFSFDGDSREYFEQDKLMRLGVACANIYNDGTLEEFERNVLNVVEYWLGEVNA